MMVAAACAVPWPVSTAISPSAFMRTGMIAGCEGIDLVEVVAFNPVLEFAGCVAGVSALLEHGDHHNLHGNRAWFHWSRIGDGGEQEEGCENTHACSH